MTPERWQHVDRVWHAVLLRPEAERAHALVELCGADEELRREVESLLQSLDRASAAGFGASPGVMLHAMPLAGRQVGHYAVTELLGVGGMGEVYRAHDSTLGRDVALKVLSHSWLADSDARMRFEREARILASLNHPNIAAIHGIEEDARPLGGEPPVRALVLELVEGETLADRLARESGALPVDEAVIIALQVADALEAAHARGIVHRDLKPSNIKITPEGNVKVLDFGLARVISGEGQSGPAGSPTVTLGSTDASLPLGTARYMSPEQIRGREVDRRADIWAFGCVLYEMMTGTPAFPGDDVADLLAEVVEGEPEWTALPPATPPNVRLCLQCCLQKAPRQRFHDIGDVRLALTGAFSSQLGESDAPGKTSRLASVGWAMSLLAVAAAAVFVTLFARPPEAPETRLEIVTPPVYEPLAIDISPDGRTVAFQANDSGLPRLWIRRLDASDAEPLAGTDFATMPFWSPDGRSIGYFSGVELKRIDLEERFVRTLAPAPHARGGTWNRDGTIVFGAVAMGPLHSTPAGGGTVTQVTSLLPGQTSHRWPQFLPDGRRFLLTALGTPEVRGLYVGSLDDRTVRRVSDRDSAFAFMPPDILLVGRNGGLMARRLSDDLTVVNTEPVPVAPKLFVSPQLTGIGALRASAAGHIVYRAAPPRTQLVWLDRGGREVAAVGEADDTGMAIESLSPDGRTVAVQRMVDGNSDVWLIDLERGAPRRLTVAQGFDGAPVFSPDGRRVAYMSDDAADVFDRLFVSAADGTGDRTLLVNFGVPDNHYPEDWSPDGRWILYSRENAGTQSDVFAVPTTGAPVPIEIAGTAFFEANPRFSPDGRWVVYDSDETGSSQVFIRPFPGPAPNRQISSAGGGLPRWRADGGELFYLEKYRLMAVPVIRRGTSLEFGAPRALFTFPPRTGPLFEPSPDGQRFLVMKVVTEASPITLIQNWKRR